MRWPWARKPTFLQVVAADPLVAVEVVIDAVERGRPPSPPAAARLLVDVFAFDTARLDEGFVGLAHRLGVEGLRRGHAALVAVGATELAGHAEAAVAIASSDEVALRRLRAAPLEHDDDSPLQAALSACDRGYRRVSRTVAEAAIDTLLACDDPWFDRATAAASFRSELQLDADAALSEAMTYRHAGLVRRAIAAGARVRDVVRFNGGTLLHEATGLSNLDIAAALLEAGVPVDAEDERGFRALDLAAMDDRSGPLVRLLLAHGASAATHDGRSPLHAVRDVDAATALLAAGADARARRADGIEPLHLVTDVAVAEVLLAAGADPRSRTAHGQTSLHLVAARDSLGDGRVLRRLLVAGADATLVDDAGRIALHEASTAGAVAVLVEAGNAVDARDHRGRTPLMTVAGPEAVAALLARGAAVDAVDDDGRTALHHPRIHYRLIDGLVAAGARLDVVDRHDQTPLVRARAAYQRTEDAVARDYDEPGASDQVIADGDYCTREWVAAIAAATAAPPGSA